MKRVRPTLDEVRRWPATVSVADSARALCLSRAGAYEAIRTGQFPAKTISVGGRISVVTASLLRLLDPDAM